MARLRIAACQIDTSVGDLDGNVERILDAYRVAAAAGADIAAFPELAITGYPPDDLLLKPGFVTASSRPYFYNNCLIALNRVEGFFILHTV